MKRAMSVTLIAVVAVVVIGCMPNVIYATSRYEVYDSIGFVTSKDRANEIISDCFNDGLASATMSSFLKSTDADIPLHYDISAFLIEYNVSTGFLDEMETLDKNYLNHSVPEYPTIYVPIFGELSGGERVIGHIKLYYTYDFERGEWRYDQYTVFNNTDGFEVEGRPTVNFFETISNLAENTSWDHAFLLRFPSAFNDSSEKILLIYDGDEIKVFDLYNSAGAPATPEDAWQFNKMYSYDEYVSLRRERERTVYSKDSSSSNSSESGRGTKTEVLIGAIIVASAVIISGTVLIIRKARKKAVEKINS